MTGQQICEWLKRWQRVLMLTWIDHGQQIIAPMGSTVASWIVMTLMLMIGSDVLADQPGYSIPPLSVLQPRLIDQRYRIPTGEVESYRPVVPCNVIVIRQPVWVLIGWDYHSAFGVWTPRYQLAWY
jgi:hypothetical protein